MQIADDIGHAAFGDFLSLDSVGIAARRKPVEPVKRDKGNNEDAEQEQARQNRE